MTTITLTISDGSVLITSINENWVLTLISACFMHPCQVEGYEVSVGGGYAAPCQPGPLQADLYDDYRAEILQGRR